MSLDTSAAPLGARNATLTDLRSCCGAAGPQGRRRRQCVRDPRPNGQLVVDGTAPVLGEDGVTLTTGTYTPTNVCDQASPTSSGSRRLPAAHP